MKSLSTALFTVVMVVSLLTGCGGGGGGGSTPADTTGNAGTGSYTISGKVAEASGVGMAGVSMALTGSGSATATTDSTGNYSITGLANGTYTLTPTKAGYTCSPASKTITVNNADVAGQDFVGSDAGTPTPSGALRVRVAGWNDHHLSNKIVVLGDGTGAMITHGTTDASGEIIFNNPPANATISSANTSTACQPWERKLFATYDVNVPAITVYIPDCGDTSPATPQLGDITVNLVNIPAGVNGVTINAGNAYAHVASTGITNNQGQATLTIYPQDLQSDGKVSIVAITSNYNDRISYGLLTDQTVVTGMIVTIAADQPFTNAVQYQLTSIPATIKGYAGYIYQSRKEAQIGNLGAGNWGLTSTVTSTTMSVPYIPGFQDSSDYDVYVGLDRNNNGQQDAQVGFFVGSGPATVPSNQAFDFSQMLTIPSNLAVSLATGTATPTFSWSGIDAGARYIWGNSSNFDFDAAPSRTSIVFPELPASLNDFRPTSLPQDFRVENSASTLVSDYNDLQTKRDQYFSGTLDPHSTAYTTKWSKGEWSSAQTLAPVLNKAAAPTASRTPRNRFGR